jgi:hypothetical protein
MPVASPNEIRRQQNIAQAAGGGLGHCKDSVIINAPAPSLVHHAHVAPLAVDDCIWEIKISTRIKKLEHITGSNSEQYNIVVISACPKIEDSSAICGSVEDKPSAY